VHGFGFVCQDISDLHRDAASSHGALRYALDIAVNLLIWPVYRYFFGLAMWRVFQKKFSEIDTWLPIAS
jgi:hypothetical protein